MGTHHRRSINAAQEAAGPHTPQIDDGAKVGIYKAECHSLWRRKDLVTYAATRMSLVDVLLNEKQAVSKGQTWTGPSRQGT